MLTSRLGRVLDLTKPFFFNARTDTFYQKNEDNAFSVVDGDEEEYDEALKKNLCGG